MQLADSFTEDKVVTDKYEMYWIKPGIFYVHLFKDSHADVNDIEQIVSFELDQNVGVDHGRIVHAEKFATISKDARELLQKTAPTVRADAFVMPSVSQRIIFNIYTKFRRNRNPIKAFDDLNMALGWLEKF